MAFVLVGGGLAAAYTLMHNYNITKESLRGFFKQGVASTQRKQLKDSSRTKEMEALKELRARRNQQTVHRTPQVLIHQPPTTELTEEYVHPLEIVRKKRSLLPVKTFMKTKGTKRTRKGNTSELAESLKLEDYDMTNEFPYEDVKVYDVTADGDCLFHCVRKVLDDLNIQVTIKRLREIVARSVGDKEFTMLQSIYTMAERENETELMTDYGYMKYVTSVPELRRAIMTRNYFGDEMAIRAIERAYPVKFMVIRMLEDNRIELSRRFSDEEVNDKPWFAMLLLNLRAVHYELISYNDKNVMRREELPSKIQRLMAQVERETERRKKEEAELEALKRDQEETKPEEKEWTRTISNVTRIAMDNN